MITGCSPVSFGNYSPIHTNEQQILLIFHTFHLDISHPVNLYSVLEYNILLLLFIELNEFEKVDSIQKSSGITAREDVEKIQIAAKTALQEKLRNAPVEEVDDDAEKEEQ